mgnify:FL=1
MVVSWNDDVFIKAHVVVSHYSMLKALHVLVCCWNSLLLELIKVSILIVQLSEEVSLFIIVKLLSEVHFCNFFINFSHLLHFLFISSNLMLFFLGQIS